MSRLVSIKLLLDQSQEECARFMTEAHAMAYCQHPNIVQIHEVGEFEGRVFICREFVHGLTLEQHMAVNRSVREAARVVTSLAEAVEHMHVQGVVHRSLTPENVLLTKDGEPKLIGFHRVRFFDETQNAQEARDARGRDIHALGQLLGLMAGPSDRSLGAIRAKCLPDAPQHYQRAKELANDLRAFVA